jgi:hypothetical protein
MRQIEVCNPDAGECVEHPECFVEIWHPLSPCTSSLLLKATHERSAEKIATGLKSCKQSVKH